MRGHFGEGQPSGNVQAPAAAAQAEQVQAESDRASSHNDRPGAVKPGPLPLTEMRQLFCDLETYSTEPIANGSHRYAEKAEVMLWSFAIDDEPVQVWDLTAERDMPLDLEAALADDSVEVWFQNGGHFDFVVLEHAMPDVHIAEHRRRDTMVQALSHGLPGALEKLGAALGLAEEQRKIADGKRLVRLFCQPHTEKDGSVVRYTRHTHPADWERFKEYAGGDIVTMRAAHRKMPLWNFKGKQVALWHLDCRINSRGFAVDLDLAHAAVRASDAEKARLAKQVQTATDGAVGAATQRDEMLRYILEAHGVTLPDLQADTVERRIDDPDLPDAVRELLAIRLQASRNTSAKFKALLKRVSSDGRLRGTMQFRGAARTGRWAHRAFQPGNLMRPTMSHTMVETAIEALKAEAEDLVFDDVMEAIGNTVRGAIVAAPGKKLVVADLANIEGRMAAWLAGEEWKLDAFRAYDRGEGKDLYILAYAKSFNVDPDTVPPKGDERQIGKVEELMFQYGGGVGAWITGAATYGIDLAKMTEQVYPSLPQWAVEEAEQFLQWLEEPAKKAHHAMCVKYADPSAPELDASEAKMNAALAKVRHGLAPKVFVACDAIKRLWRSAHPRISSYWKELEDTVRAAVAAPGTTLPCRKVKIRRDGGWLRIGLPSGRALCYPSIQVDEKTGEISYVGLDQYTKRWQRIKTYGGKLCIAEGTLVLTRHRAWVPIEHITSVDEVWDGGAWVPTAGLLSKGPAEVIEAYGAWMTPDHEVLTKEGWKRASQRQGHHRAACRLPDGIALPQQRWQEVVVGDDVCLRSGEGACGHRDRQDEEARRSSLVRLHEASDDRRAQHQARHVGAPGVLGVAGHDRPLPTPIAPRMGEVWRAWHQSLQALGEVIRRLLGGYGAYVSAWAHAGAQGQRSGLLTSQLRVGNAPSAGEQQEQQPRCARPVGEDNGGRALGENRHRPHNDLLPVAPWFDGARPGGEARRVAAVYDLMDCGPLNRFTILAGGEPLIVHNCENIVQAAACDQLAECMPLAEAEGYAVVLSVHDELVTEVPDEEAYSADRLGEIMCSDLGWNAGLPLAAAGFESKRYKKE